MSELALQLIQEARKTRATVLDLGNCGLTEVPGELFEMAWLETLILGDRWIEYSFETNKVEKYRSSNHGPRSNLKILGKGWHKLVALKKLIVSGNSISDLLSLSNLSNLQSIICGGNQIRDLSPLSNLSNLQSINCGGNQIRDLSPLSNLTNLQLIDIWDNQISDLSPLSNLTNLQSISCGGNQISDLSPLSNLSNLQALNCWGILISNLSPLSNLSNLQALNCNGNPISDLSPLSNLSNLQELNCNDNQISDLSPLSNLINLQSISCGHNPIISLSPLSNLSNLQILNCGGNQISDLSPFSNLSNLQALNCNGNQISDLSSLSNLTNLQELKCGGNQISDLSPLSNLSNLQELNCYGNQISDLSPLSNLSNLQVLNCEGNQISGLSSLLNLTNLQELNCYGNQISDLSPLSNLINLQMLNCYGNPISDLSPLSNLSNLQELNCGGNPISDLSPLSNLSNLQSIFCMRNQISDLSPLSNLSNLQSIFCVHNQISDLSPLSNLTNLQELKCGGNQISDLSPLSNLYNLQELNCEGNPISDLSPLSNLTNLYSISCGGNPISDLSPLSNLTNLYSISCGGNQISDLSPLSNLYNLQMLNCSNNQISDLSPLSNLSNLRSIDCNDNQISDLSPLSNLSNLRSIDCNDNQITSLEPLLPLIKKAGKTLSSYFINKLNINNCPITIPPLEIVKKGNQDILRWFEERDLARMQGATVYLLEAKCLILGEGGSGKTTLTRKLMDAAAPMPQEKETTKGIDVQKLELLLRDGRNVQVHLWDFGGQEIYHATHQFFLTKRSLYILLDDTRKDDHTLHDPVFNYWLQVVELYGGGSPLLIVQNEKDDRSKGIDLEGMKGRFGFIQMSLATNLATNRGLHEVREAIKECVKNLPHIGEEQPLAWLEIRQGLEQLTRLEEKDHIPVETYLNICKAHGIAEPERAMFLSAYLHDLGVFLHFQDDPVLKDTLILNNAWATAAVYRLLDDEPVKKNNGRFMDEDLQRIWHEPRYAGQHKKLLALMERFELCYKLPGQSENTWLATQLLPVSRPAQLDWPAKPDVHFRFEYVFLPKGLLSNHIVRMNKLVKDPSLAWRTGVLLEQEGAKALVTETYGGREIRVQAVGEMARKLINQVYHDFSTMHLRFEGLKVRTMLPCTCDICLKLLEPQYYDLEDLKTRVERGKNTIECRNSFKDVSVLALLLYLFEINEMASDFSEGFFKGFYDNSTAEKALNIALQETKLKYYDLLHEKVPSKKSPKKK